MAEEFRRAPVVLALVTAAILASQAKARAAEAAQDSRANQEALEFYPRAAKSAHVQGCVELACGRNEHNALRNCTLPMKSRRALASETLR